MNSVHRHPSGSTSGPAAGPASGLAPASTSPSGRGRVEADAAARGLTVSIVSRPEARSLHEAAELLGIAPGELVKTLVVKRSDGSYLFALVPGGRRISWPKLRAVVGVNKLSMPSPDAALAATGYARGSITPLGSSTNWPVYADVLVPGGRVALGAGEQGASAFIDAEALLASLDATVADITEPE